MNAVVRSAITGIALVACHRAAIAQTCAPSASSNEAAIFGIRSLTLAATPGAAPAHDASKALRIGAELAWLPDIDDETATPTACRPGKGPENVNTLPGILRLRASLDLPYALTVHASYLPPVRLAGMRGNLLGAAVSRTQPLTSSFDLTARAHMTFGDIDGPITCDDEAIREPGSVCFAGTPSTDRFTPGIRGVDATLSPNRPERRLRWFAGAGYSQLRPRFRVHFENNVGEVDSTRVEVDMDRITLFGGGTWMFTAARRLSFELYGTVEDGVTGRLVFDAVVLRVRERN